MWKHLLSLIQKAEAKYGSTLRKPATNEEIKNLQKAFQDRLDHRDINIPDPFIEFLKTVNGLDFNGLSMYGVDRSLLDREVDEEICGFIETNEIWYENEWQAQYMFFGDSDTAWYCFDMTNKVYLELDKPSGTVMDTYGDFYAMLEHALATRIVY